MSLIAMTAAELAADQLDLVGPPGSGRFGTSVTVLPNGNFVVTDPGYDLPGGPSDVGAVYLYDSKGLVISKLTGGTSSDAVGSGGVYVVGSGNFVVRSPDWSAGTAKHDAGAVTWGSGVTGISGVVSSANSLVGTKANDRVGSAGTTMGGITVLTNGNYVVSSQDWGNGTANSVGAVTWGNGNSGVTGEVSATNSMVGSKLNDQIGRYRVVPLNNGNYVMRNPLWDNGAVTDAGAVTWGSGTGGTVGVVGPANSLVGGSANDQVGYEDSDRKCLTVLSNGNYVVWSPLWDSGAAQNAGAVTWGDGSTGRSGVIASTNSLVGVSAGDFFSWVEVTELTNGHYVVCLPGWKNGAAVSAGAAMWCDGTLGRTGTVSSSNALVGTAAQALVGYMGAVTPLANGNYVVASRYWHNGGLTNAGAVTWCDGTVGRTGTISSSNSLVGSAASNNIGSGGVLALPNGHYVVCSPYAVIGSLGQAGAVTWCNGVTGRSGLLNATNSLVGAKAGDQVGVGGAVLLANGHYVVSSFFADNGSLEVAGAVTWCNGNTGRTGAISNSNSLMGAQANDRVGSGEVKALTNGNYVVRSSIWKNGSGLSVGAVTWCDGSVGRSGTVTAANSLTGSGAGDNIGHPGIVALPNGNYVVPSWYWDNGSAADAGAVTWGDGSSGSTGVISAANSLVGTTADDQISYGGISVLPGGGFVVRSHLWDNGSAVSAGAVTWGSGTSALTGVVSATNSLVGVTLNDRVGEGLELVGVDGAYLFSSPVWNNGAVSDAGSVVLIPPGSGRAGSMPAGAGIAGNQATRGSSLSFDYDASRKRAVIGRPYENVVSLFSHDAVLSPQDRYELWAISCGLVGAERLADAMPFHDGVANLLKYAFNLNGTTGDVRVLTPGGSAGLPRFSLESNGTIFRVEYLRRRDSGLSYLVECSETLDANSFVSMGGSDAVTTIDSNWERVVREVAVTSPRCFGRVVVSLP